MRAFEEIVSRLEGVKSSDNGGKKALCPAHDDEHRSLGVDPGEKGALVRCHREPPCSAYAIMAALDLPAAALFDDWWEKRERDQPATARAKARAEPVRTLARYRYYDAEGVLVQEVERRSDKAFPQRWPRADGGWDYTANGHRRTLYRLPDIVARPTEVVWIAEGEKDADNLAALGLVATTNPEGAGSWRDEYSLLLRGRRLVLLPDHDPAGEKHMRAVARSCWDYAAEIRVLPLPGLQLRQDVSDWLAAGGRLDHLLRLADETAPLRHLDDLDHRDHRDHRENQDHRVHLGLTPLRALLAEPVELRRWVVHDLLIVGGTSELVAKPKVGKTTLARVLALAVARGEAFLGRATTQGVVVYIAHEEKRDEVRNHFAQMGGGSEELYVFVGPAPEDPIAWLQQIVAELKPVLVVVDPLARCLRIKDMNDYAEVTRATEPVIHLARESGAHILLVHHMGKSEREDKADQVLGSTALRGSVDNTLMMRRSNDLRVLWTEQRYGPDMTETVLRMDPVTGSIEVAGDLETVLAQQAAKDVLDAVHNLTDEHRRQRPGTEPSFTEAEIRRTVGGDEQRTARALRYLVADRQLVRIGEGVSGKPYRYLLPYGARRAGPEEPA